MDLLIEMYDTIKLFGLLDVYAMQCTVYAVLQKVTFKSNALQYCVTP